MNTTIQLNRFFSTKLDISIDTLKRNLHFLRNQLVNTTEIIAVLKANAYGFGDVRLAKILIKEGIKHIAVADFEEGIRIFGQDVKPLLNIAN